VSRVSRVSDPSLFFGIMRNGDFGRQFALKYTKESGKGGCVETRIMSISFATLSRGKHIHIVKKNTKITLSLLAFTWGAFVISIGLCEPPDNRAKDAESKPVEKVSLPTVQEARARARILHETIHGALQVIHRDFFEEDESATIPSQSLEDVFAELTRNRKITLKWLVVEGSAMNVDHKPADDFEREAAAALASGQKEYEVVEGNSYRYAGAIRLSSRCLKCHVPNRKDTKDRTAGLLIGMPLIKSE